MQIQVKSPNLDKVLGAIFFVCVFSITRQINFPGISSLIIMSLLLLFIVALPSIFKNFFSSNVIVSKMFVLYGMISCVFLLYSVVILQNNPLFALRFFAILIMIPLAYFVPGKKIFIDIFIFLVVIHCLFLMIFEVYMIINSNPIFNSMIRHRYLDMGVGDIYTFNQYFFKIQILGNAIIPVAFFISVIYLKKSLLKKILLLIILIGIIIAGNFAFFVSVAFFLIGYYFLNSVNNFPKFIKTMLLGLITFALISYPVITYTSKVLDMKSESSLSTRSDQLNILIDDLSETSFSFLFGKGLGNTINESTSFRDYTGATYYELQSIYVLNQVGIIFFVGFLLLNLILSIYFLNNKYLYLIYLSYIVYAVTNPYLFDSVNILIVIILISLKKQLAQRGLQNVSSR